MSTEPREPVEVENEETIRARAAQLKAKYDPPMHPRGRGLIDTGTRFTHQYQYQQPQPSLPLDTRPALLDAAPLPPTVSMWWVRWRIVWLTLGMRLLVLKIRLRRKLSRPIPMGVLPTIAFVYVLAFGLLIGGDWRECVMYAAGAGLAAIFLVALFGES